MQLKSLLIKLLTVVLLTGAGVLTVVTVMKFFGPLPLSINSTVSQKASLFYSEGKSEMEVVPDEAKVSLGINIQKDTVGVAQDEANKVINAITAKLAELGIDKEDVKTSNYSIYPNYDYTNGTNRIIGYNINSNLEVTISDFDKLNSVIDLATAEGANQVGGVQFTLSKEKEAELKQQARQEAIKDAQESAQELARLSGIRLGRVVDVSESRMDAWPVSPMYRSAEIMMNKDAYGAGGEPTSIEPGSTTYSYVVNLSYETF